VDDANQSSQEQTRGIDEVAKAIAQIEQVAQRNAANAEETAPSAVELNAQSATLKELVARVTAIVGGGRRGRTVEPA
jgi:methyl-accepting chemotaxis protein